MFKIRYGLTGNYYVTSESKEEVIEASLLIGKALSSIYYNSKFKVYVIRIKSWIHKRKIKEYLGVLQPSYK